MSKDAYKYQSWEDSLYAALKPGGAELSKENIDAVMQQVNAPEMKSFFEHQASEISKAKQHESMDYRWEFLENSLHYAQAAFEGGSVYVTAIASMQLGRAIERLKHRPNDEVVDLLETALSESKLQLEKLKRGRFNHKKEYFKKMVQEKAAEVWAGDARQKLLMIDMCRLMHEIFLPAARQFGSKNYLPTKAEGLKPWLRDIAPPYARRQGRRSTK